MILSTHLFCLLNLSTTRQFCTPLLLTYTFDVLYLILQHNQANTIRYLLCIMHYTLCTMHYSLCTIHYSLCTIHYTLYIMHYILCIIHYALCTMHYAYVFIRICTYLLFYTYSYVFTISRGNPTKSRDFGTHA